MLAALQDDTARLRRRRRCVKGETGRRFEPGNRQLAKQGIHGARQAATRSASTPHEQLLHAPARAFARVAPYLASASDLFDILATARGELRIRSRCPTLTRTAGDSNRPAEHLRLPGPADLEDLARLYSLRFVSFLFVGLIGVFVHLAALWLGLLAARGSPRRRWPPPAIAMTSSFFLNNAIHLSICLKVLPPCAVIVFLSHLRRWRAGQRRRRHVALRRPDTGWIAGLSRLGRRRGVELHGVEPGAVATVSAGGGSARSPPTNAAFCCRRCPHGARRIRRHARPGHRQAYTVATARTFAEAPSTTPSPGGWPARHAGCYGTEVALAVRLPFILPFLFARSCVMFALTRLLFGKPRGCCGDHAQSGAVLAWTTSSFVLPDGPLPRCWRAPPQRVLFRPRAGVAAPGGWRQARAATLPVEVARCSCCRNDAVPARHAGKRHWLFSHGVSGCWHCRRAVLPVIASGTRTARLGLVLAFRGGRARVARLAPLAPFAVLAGHALFFLPWLWVPLVISLVRALRNGRAMSAPGLIACLAIRPIVAVFTLVAVSGNRVLCCRWAAPGCLLPSPCWARLETIRNRAAQGHAHLARLDRRVAGRTPGRRAGIGQSVLAAGNVAVHEASAISWLETVSWSDFKTDSRAAVCWSAPTCSSPRRVG